MKVKFGIFGFLMIFALLFTTCDFLNGDENNNNGNGTQSGGVEPLIQTKWAQGDPFNSMLPMVGGILPLADCSNTAIAQLMKFHGHPIQGSGRSEPYSMNNGTNLPSMDFNVKYDWRNMLNAYTNNANEQQRNAVATLVYHIGLSRQFDWSNNNSVTSVQRALYSFFGYDKDIQRHYRIYYDDATWETMIKNQLDIGLPIYYWGTNQTRSSNHTFIIDGYDNIGKYHINWGWNGKDDGYFSLNALNPQNYNFNYDHTMIINIKPDKGGIGSNLMALNEITPSEKISVNKNEQFSVTARIRSMGYFPGGYIGAALIDNDGNMVVIGYVSLVEIHSGNTWLRGISNCSVPNTVTPGQYKLKIITRITGEDWKIITLSMPDVPNSIDFEVK